MTSRISELAIDCADPARLAAFWCEVLGHVVLEEEDGLVTIGAREADDDGGVGRLAPVLTFARVPEPKRGKNRLHLDLSPVDREQTAEVERVVGLGARRIDVGQGDASWVVLADPEGNEFCVLAGRRV